LSGLNVEAPWRKVSSGCSAAAGWDAAMRLVTTTIPMGDGEQVIGEGPAG
jgi:hypothetical protein